MTDALMDNAVRDATQIATAVVRATLKGEASNHPFRGNQYKSGIGGGAVDQAQHNVRGVVAGAMGRGAAQQLPAGAGGAQTPPPGPAASHGRSPDAQAKNGPGIKSGVRRPLTPQEQGHFAGHVQQMGEAIQSAKSSGWMKAIKIGLNVLAAMASLGAIGAMIGYETFYHNQLKSYSSGSDSTAEIYTRNGIRYFKTTAGDEITLGPITFSAN